MTDQTNIREYLLSAVPICEVPSGGKYVFPKDIPQPYQDQFLRDTAGQTAKRIDGELAYFDYDFMAWLNRSYSHIRLKHQFSSAADLEIDYQIDTTNHVVSLQANAFDSALIADFLNCVLLQRNGIVAIRDDRTEWNPERPPYRVFLTLCGLRYELTAHRLPKEVGGGIAVVLNHADFIDDEYMKEKQARSAEFSRQVKLGLAKSTDASMFHGAAKNSTVKYRNEEF